MVTENKENSKYKFQGTGLSVAERNFAKKAFNKYLSTYSNPSYSELQLLEELVYRESLDDRHTHGSDEVQVPTRKEQPEERAGGVRRLLLHRATVLHQAVENAATLRRMVSRKHNRVKHACTAPRTPCSRYFKPCGGWTQAVGCMK